MEGWIKVHRKMLDNPLVFKDADHAAVWMYLLLNATHTDYPAIFKGRKIMLSPGQLITGRKVISDKLHISESKVQRILKWFETDHQIEQQASNKNRLITVVNWGFYQNAEQQNAPQTDGKQTGNGHKQECKNVKNEKNNILCAPKPHESELENQLKSDFEKIYAIYPKKVGKTNAFISYKKWISEKGRNIGGKHYRLTNRQIYFAVKKYVQQQEEAGQEDYQYWKNFDTLMGRQLLDYVEGVE